ncbi:MFS transporter [Candidatus Pacearchaeota archaeon]|nr:MFS transporter [Candidatus Pacearchaeota archaeon]
MQKKVGADEEKLRQGALNVSIQEGSANSFSTGISSSYITPFALALKANAFHIGILSALSGLVSPAAQLWGSKLMESYGRKKIVLVCVFWQALMWLPIAIVALLAWKNALSFTPLIYGLIAGYTLMVTFGGIAHPPWFSWMGDLVPEHERGKYFSKRNLITGIVELSAVIIALIVVDNLQHSTKLFLGFSVLFILACIFRLLSYKIFHRQYAPHLRPREKYKTSFTQVLKQNKDFSKFIYYQLFFNIALMIASPFFAVYMLQERNFSYNWYIYITISSSLFYLLFTPLIGKISDNKGNKTLLWMANIGFVFTPLLWIVDDNPVWLIFVPQLVAGLANAALTIALTNYTYSNIPDEQRGEGVAVLNLITGVGTFIGSLIGGYILQNVSSTILNSKYFFIFVVASACRLLVALIFLPGLHETEEKKHKHAPAHVHLAHPFKTAHVEAGWASPPAKKVMRKI